MYYSTWYPSRRSYYGPSPVIPFVIIVGLLLVIFWEPLCDWQVYAYEVKESIGSNVLIISFVTVVAFMFLLGLVTDALVVIVPLAFVVVILPFLNHITVVLVLLVLIAFLGTHYYPTQKFVSYDRGRLHPGTSRSCDRNDTYLGFGLSSSLLCYVVMLASLVICITYYEDEASRWICLALVLITVLFFNFTGFGDDRSGYAANKTGLNSWNWNWNWLRSPDQYRNYTGSWHGSGTNSGLMSLSFGLLGYLAMVVCIFLCMMFCNINVTWCYTMAFVLLIALYFNYNEPEIKRYRLY